MHRRLIVLATVLGVLVPCGLPAAAPGHTVSRALVDVETMSASATPALQLQQLHEIGAHLGARYVRVALEWHRAEPQADVYDEAYLARLDTLLEAAAVENIRVVVTVTGTPRWASDTVFWQTPPWNTPRGAYRPFYAPRAGAVDDLGAFAGLIAARFKGRVFAYECWNEPNIWTFMYPQRTDLTEFKGTAAYDRDGGDFAARRYAQLLKAFAPAVRAADPDALVIGGATAPIGNNDKYRTSPQRFARLLKALGALPSMDAYSHHPYQPGPAVRAPEAAPLTPSTTVSLQNLGTLLSIVPGMPFYLTEYGYNTSASLMFGVKGMTQIKQADYLKRAYAFARRYTRVKALFWYLRRDGSPSGRADDPNGVYTGLRTIANARKRSWYAYTRAMRLTISAPARIGGTRVTVKGTLTCASLAADGLGKGAVGGRAVVVQRRTDGRWVDLRTTTTESDGAYRARVTLRRTGQVRAVWRGVVASTTRRIVVD
jgi:hypothetical protein